MHSISIVYFLVLKLYEFPLSQYRSSPPWTLHNARTFRNRREWSQMVRLENAFDRTPHCSPTSATPGPTSACHLHGGIVRRWCTAWYRSARNNQQIMQHNFLVYHSFMQLAGPLPKGKVSLLNCMMCSPFLVIVCCPWVRSRRTIYI